MNPDKAVSRAWCCLVALVLLFTSMQGAPEDIKGLLFATCIAKGHQPAQVVQDLQAGLKGVLAHCMQTAGG